MKIEGLGIRELRMRLKNPFQTSFGTFTDRRVLLVEAYADGLVGRGEVTAGMGPFYSPETIDTAWHIFCDYLAPLALGKEFETAAELPRILEPIRGHEMAKAALENALWDIESQGKAISLATLLGGTLKEIPCGVSLGIRENVKELLAEVERELAAGYQRIKIKIMPGKDLEVAAAVRAAFPGVNLMVDANSAYTLANAAHLQRFDELKLMMIEQPLGWDDIYEHAKLQAVVATPLCLDECIHNYQQAEAAVQLQACRIINIKLGRVGGHSEARRIHDYCHARGVPVWCGGMLESGIGRAHNIAMSALPGFVLPGDVSASRRYWDEDIIDPEVEVTSSGTIRVPETPGLGFEVKQKQIERLTSRAQSFQSAGTVAVGTPKS